METPHCKHYAASYLTDNQIAQADPFNESWSIQLLSDAAYKGYLSVLQSLHAQYGPFNQDNGEYIMWYALEGGHVEIVDFLLAQGYRVNFGYLAYRRPKVPSLSNLIKRRKCEKLVERNEIFRMMEA